MKPLALIAFLLSPLVIDNSGHSNIDGLIALGFVLPPQIGLFLLLAKPQIGIGIAVFWFVEAWRNGRLLQIMKIFVPVTIALLISFLLYGLWPLKILGSPNSPHNWSLWPLSLPIGFGLLIFALRKRTFRTATAAGPFLSPYVSRQTWAIALLGIQPNALEYFVAIAVLWVLRFIGML